MRQFLITLAMTSAAFTSLPATAAIVSLANDADLSQSPYTVNIGSTASYTFSYVPDSANSVALSMSGTAEVYGNGFFSPNSPDPLQLGVLIPGQLSLGEFFMQTGTQSIPYSIALTSVALRFMSNNQTFYGYAIVGGSTLTQFAYNDTPDGPITTGQLPDVVPGAVPEPATWVLQITGFAALSVALRRRRTRVMWSMAA